MPDITIPGWLLGGLNVLLAFLGAFGVALWLSMVVWTFRDVKSRSRDAFAIALATLMVVIFGPLGLLLYFLLRPQVTLAELYERSLEEEALLQDLEERARCSGCSRLVDNHWIVCPDCHTQLKRVCANCNEKLNLQWNICPSCATPVSQSQHQHVQQNGGHDAPTEVGHTQFQRPNVTPSEASTYMAETRPVNAPEAVDESVTGQNEPR